MKTRAHFYLMMAVSGCLGFAASQSLADETAAPASHHRSEFTAVQKTHNPFWPIGWAGPSVAHSAPIMHGGEIKPEDFTVSSISIGNQISAAVINGNIYDEGQYVPLENGSQKIYVQVVRITDQGVVLQYQNRRVMARLGGKSKPAKP